MTNYVVQTTKLKSQKNCSAYSAGSRMQSSLSHYEIMQSQAASYAGFHTANPASASSVLV